MLNFRTGDVLELKKIHPCGGKRFSVIFAGSDVKISCTTCGRELLVPRVKLEKSIKRVISGEDHD